MALAPVDLSVENFRQLDLADLGHESLRHGKSGEMLCGNRIIRGSGFFQKGKGVAESPVRWVAESDRLHGSNPDPGCLSRVIFLIYSFVTDTNRGAGKPGGRLGSFYFPRMG
jgi:hypothetical protein